MRNLKLLQIVFLLFFFTTINGQENCLKLWSTSSYGGHSFGDTVCVDIMLQGDISVAGMQFSMNWNPLQLEFVGLENLDELGLNEATDFGIREDFLSRGYFTFGWIDPTGMSTNSVQGGLRLFSICFRVINTEPSPILIKPSGNPTPIEIVDSNINPFIAQIIYGELSPLPIPTNELQIDELCVTPNACNTTSTGAIKTVVTGGNSNYTFNWSGPNNSTSEEQSPQNLSAGNYFLTVSDASGYEKYAEVVVTSELDNQLINFDIVDYLCGEELGGIIEITPKTGVAIEEVVWSTGETGNLISELLPGNYQATITFSNQPTCSSIIREFTVKSIQNIPSKLSVSPITDCGNFNGSIDVTPSVYYQNPVYNWNTGEQTEDLSNLYPGIFTVTIAEAGQAYCQETLSAEITSFSADDFNVQINYPSSCSGSSGSITLLPPGNQPLDGYSFEWGNNNSSNTLTDVSPGTYSVVVFETGSGCTDTLSIVVEDQSFQVVANWVCFNSSGPDSATVNIAAFGPNSPFSFDWGDGNPVTDDFSASFNALAEETYFVTVTNSLGCSEVKTITPDCNISTSLYIAPNIVETDREFCVEVGLQGLIDLVSCQFTIQWDTTYLEFIGVDNFQVAGLDDRSFNINENYLLLSWNDPQLFGIPVSGNQPFFDLCFRSKNLPGSTVVEFSNSPLMIEIASDRELDNFDLFNGNIEILEGPIWPGDTNRDSIANNEDLLAIGLAYGNSGPIRDNATIDWVGQSAPDWENGLPQSGINFKFIDTDGNGIINDADTMALSQNWFLNRTDGLHPSTTSPSPKLNGPPLYVANDTFSLGQQIELPILLGEENLVAEDIYGVSFTIQLEDGIFKPSTLKISFEESWFGSNNILGMYKVHPTENAIQVAITKTDGMDISGFGQIATFHATIEDVIFKDRNDTIEINVGDIRLINYSEMNLPVNGQSTSSSIEVSTSNNEQLQSIDFTIFPNPASQTITLKGDLSEVNRIEIRSIQGALLYSTPTLTNHVNIRNLPGGIYYCYAYTQNGVGLKRFIIMR